MTIDRDPHRHRPPRRADAADLRRRDRVASSRAAAAVRATRRSNRTGRIPTSRRSRRRRTALKAFAGAGARRRRGRVLPRGRSRVPSSSPASTSTAGSASARPTCSPRSGTSRTGRSTSASFIEYTALVGALGYQNTVELLRGARAALHRRVRARRPGRHDGDDPAARRARRRAARASPRPPTRRRTRSARAGSPRRTSCARSTRCPPSFETLRIDGLDYRHRDARGARRRCSTTPQYEAAIADAAARGRRVGRRIRRARRAPRHACTRRATSGSSTGSTVDRPARRARARPTRPPPCGSSRSSTGVYDAEVPILATGVPLDRVFGDEMLAGGYRKKYLRAISRLIASHHSH